MRRVTIHNSRQWAVGLQWFMGTGNAKLTIADLRREAATQDSALDMVAYRQRQYGFAASGGAVRDWLGARALAAAVRVASPSFLGLFALADDDGEFWWVFAMSQSLIVGMGDQVFANRADAEEWIQSLQGLLDSEFGETVTCETVEESLHWLTPLISAGPFSRLRSRNGHLQPLQPIPGQRRKLAILGSIAVALLLGGYAVKLFFAHQAGKRAMEAARIAMIDREQRKRELLAHPERHFPQPWTTAPDMRLFVSSGIKRLLALPLVASGWELERAVYDGQAVVATWEHKPGADYVHLPPSARIETPKKAVSRIRMPEPQQRDRRTVMPLLSQEACSRLLYQGTQILGSRLRLVFKQPEKKRIDKVEITAPWARGEWELSEVPPAMLRDAVLPEVFFRIPGIMLGSISYKKSAWIIKGTVYVAAKR